LDEEESSDAQAKGKASPNGKAKTNGQRNGTQKKMDGLE
jgi:hypothetical protein